MSGHVKEHCNTPRAIFKKVGTVWLCTCGTAWVIKRRPPTYYDTHVVKEWVKVNQILSSSLVKLKELEKS